VYGLTVDCDCGGVTVTPVAEASLYMSSLRFLSVMTAALACMYLGCNQVANIM